MDISNRNLMFILLGGLLLIVIAFFPEIDYFVDNGTFKKERTKVESISALERATSNEKNEAKEPNNFQEPDFTEDGEQIYDFTEVQPEYPGGINELRSEVQRAYMIPSSFQRSGKKGGTVVTQFLINKDGTIGMVKVVKKIENCDECSKSAIKAIQQISRDFSPGMQAGVAVPVWYTLPIVIQIR